MKTTLTIEESARLIELGVDAKLASSNYVGRWVHYSTGSFADPDSVEPVFTLADILSILPKEIELDGVRASLQMYQHLAGYWIASYVIYDGNRIIHQRPLSADKELIITLYQLLIWCLTEKKNQLNTEKK